MRQLSLSIGTNHPILLTLLRSKQNRQQFMRDLLRRDITDHQGILNSKKPRPRIKPEQDPKPIFMNINLDEERDADIIAHMDGIKGRNLYMIGLLYFSIGEIPEEYTRGPGRPALPKDEREKNRAESLAKAKAKYLSRKKRYNFFFNYRWWSDPRKGRIVLVWLNEQANKSQYLKDVIRGMIHGSPVECDITNPVYWYDSGEAIGFNYSDHFDLILDTEEDADIISWFEKRDGYDLKPLTLKQRSGRSFYVPTEIAKDVARAIASSMDRGFVFVLGQLADKWEDADNRVLGKIE